MKLLDLSQPIYHGGPNCPAHPPVKSEIIADHPVDGWRLELLTLASHTGSHVDAPLHKVAGGADIDGIALDSFVGPACVVDIRGIGANEPITPQLLDQHLQLRLDDTIVLLATGWGTKRAKTDEWHHHSPYLSPAAAQWLAEKNVRGVGIDHYSIGGSRDPDNTRTHEILLGANVWVVEDLNFPAEVWSLRQPFTFWALPVNLKNHSGAFCRPVALVE